MRHALVTVLFALAACEANERELIRDLPTTAVYRAATLQKEAHVVRTEADVPHVYAATRHDAAYVLGFVTARDRFFMMDLARRLGTGRIAELLGEAGLATDLQSRTTGTAFVADQIAAHLTPALADHVDAYVAGVNDYIAAVRAGSLPPPSELAIGAPFLGAASAADLMKPFERRDIAAIVALVVYQSSFQDDDVRRAAIATRLPHAFDGARDQALRQAGLVGDIWAPVIPLFQVASAPGLGTSHGAHGSTSASLAVPPVSRAMLARLADALGKMQIRLRRDRVSGFGSNAWAVAGYASASGNALAAGDGHLSLAVPSILYQLGVDTTVFGDGDLHQLGLTIPGFPLMAIGTNGDVGWSQTQLGEDITDWFREVLLLDEHGVPTASQWHDGWMPLTRVDEAYAIAAVPALGSAGGTETWSRWLTFDGRLITAIEGRAVARTDALQPGETRQAVLAGFVVPGDEDGDGLVTAVSFAYAGLYAGELLASTDALGHARDVEAFRQGTRGLVGYSQNFAVADRHGDILYTSYQPVPCRRGLPRNPDGTFAAGADPTLLLDGTRYGGWRIPILDGNADETQGDRDPLACLVPFDRVPQSIDPDAGYVVTANNDPGGLSFDGSIFDDEVYLGGPWNQGIRADTIGRSLRAEIAAGTASVAGMAKIQANIDSRLGELYVPYLRAALAHAARAAAGDPDPAERRLAAAYAVDRGAFEEIAARLDGWRARGYQAHGGVRTFYRTPNATDVDDAVATMIFNTWTRDFIVRVLGDEHIDDVLANVHEEANVRIVAQLLAGRGPSGGALLASWDPTRKESVFFDDLATPDAIETSDEEILYALGDALAFLRAAPDGPGRGGFGTRDMSKWIWGLRHQVRFASLIEDYLGDNAALKIITSQLEISTDVLSLLPPGEAFADGDPRADLHWFPRDGDQFGVDAANPGLAGRDFTHSHGPVMRMAFEMDPRGVRGQNVIPGGQSGIVDSPHYVDQVRLWLENRAYPIRFSPREVADGATAHEVFLPAGY